MSFQGAASALQFHGTAELLLQRPAQDLQLLAVARPGGGVDRDRAAIERRPGRVADLRVPLIEPIERRTGAGVADRSKSLDRGAQGMRSAGAS